MRATTKLAACIVAGLAALPGMVRAQGVWAKLPTADEFGAFCPETTDGPRNGVAIVRCKVQKTGDLTDCVVVSETPVGAGFGKAALSLTPKFKASAEGVRQMRGIATFPIRFRGAGADASPPERMPAFKSNRSYAYLGGPGPYFPDRAARMGVSGVVVMDCGVSPDLRLAPCDLVSVTPADMGFEFAAQKMAQAGWVTAGAAPANVAPRPDGVWRFRIEFKAPGSYPR